MLVNGLLAISAALVHEPSHRLRYGVVIRASGISNVSLAGAPEAETTSVKG